MTNRKYRKIRIISALSVVLLFIVCVAASVSAQTSPDSTYEAYTMPQTLEQHLPTVKWMESDPDRHTNGEIGFIHFLNKYTYGNETETPFTLQTSIGEIKGIITSTPNGSCKPTPCADIMTILEWPDGYSVSPVELVVDEQSIGVTTLYENYGV